MEPTIQIPDSFFLQSNENRSRWALIEWLNSAVAPYGISEGNIYGAEASVEAVMADTVSATPSQIFPDLEIRFRGPIPAVVSVPKGNWSHCVDVIISDFRYVGNNDFKVVKLNREVYEKNLYIATPSYTEVFNLDSLMGSHVHAYKFPKGKTQNGYFFPNSKEVITLQSKNAALQIFYMEYNWSAQNKRYELGEFNGKLWLR